MVKRLGMMTSWLNVAAIATGGAVGAVCRYFATLAVMAIPGGASMWGTALVNILGCGLLGGLIEYTLLGGSLSPRFALACRVGFIGSLTTFSTFAADSAGTAALGRWGLASFFVVLNLAAGWAALLWTASLVRGWMS